MKADRLTLSLVLTIFLAAAAHAQTAACPELFRTHTSFQEPKKVRILSLNVLGLPGLLTRKHELAPKRFAQIASAISNDNPDVAGFQELFTSNAKQLLKKSGYPFIELGPSGGFMKFFDSGLAIISRHPTRFLGEVKFGKHCEGLDCYASKGAMAVEILPADGAEPYVVINTHLNAGHENDQVRVAQIEKIATWISSLHLENRNVVFCGDFNFLPDYASYRKFISRLAQENLNFSNVGATALNDPSIRLGLEGAARRRDIFDSAIDHHFLFSGSPSTKMSPTEVRRDLTTGVGAPRLTDHFGYEVSYTLSPQAKPND